MSDPGKPPLAKRVKREMNLHVDIRQLKHSTSFSMDEDAHGQAVFLYKDRDGDRDEDSKMISGQGKNGFKLSDFDLGLEIGRGIGGSVRRAYHRQRKREFALKEINVSSSSPRHQMIKELSAHAECGDMRNIVRLYDVFYDEGLVYLVLELVSWGSLDTLLKKQDTASPSARMSEKLLAYIVREVAEALACLHDEHCMIHRDVKPSNILLGVDGTVKLGDLGTSRHGNCGCGDEMGAGKNPSTPVEGDTAMEAKETSNNNNFVGTTGYMSPQQLNDEEHSCKADIWSLGILVLECAAGHHPYIGKEGKHLTTGLLDLMQRVLTEPPPTGEGLGMSDSFVDFVSRCLKSDEKERISSSEILKHPFILNNTSDSSKEGLRLWLEKFTND